MKLTLTIPDEIIQCATERNQELIDYIKMIHDVYLEQMKTTQIQEKFVEGLLKENENLKEIIAKLSNDCGREC